MIEIICLRVLRRHYLQQHSASSGFAINVASADEQACRQLFRTHEVIFQTRCQRVTFQTDHALITLAFFRGNGDHQVTVAHQRFQIGIFRNITLHAGHAAHLLIVVAVDDGQAQRTITLQLHSDITGKLQRSGEQAGGNQQLSQYVFDRLRISMIFEDLLQGFRNGHQLAAHGKVFKQITM